MSTTSYNLRFSKHLPCKTLEFDGGLGTDFLELLEAGQTLDLTNADVTVRDIEGIDITGTGNNKLVISIDAVKEASSTTDTLEVVSNAATPSPSVKVGKPKRPSSSMENSLMSSRRLLPVERLASRFAITGH